MLVAQLVGWLGLGLGLGLGFGLISSFMSEEEILQQVRVRARVRVSPNPKPDSRRPSVRGRLQPHHFRLEALELGLARERGVAGVGRVPRQERVKDAHALLRQVLHVLQRLLHALLLPRAEATVVLTGLGLGLGLGLELEPG